MKIKVEIRKYIIVKSGKIVFEVVDKEIRKNGIFIEGSFNSYEEAEEWIKTQEDLIL